MAGVGLAQDVEGHSILDAAGHVHVLGFGVDHALPTAVAEVDRQQRRVADHVLEVAEAVERLPLQQEGLGHG